MDVTLEYEVTVTNADTGEDFTENNAIEITTQLRATARTEPRMTMHPQILTLKLRG